MATVEQKIFDKPDEIRTFDRGRVEVVMIGDSAVGRFTLEPGWRWSEHVKPIVGTQWCEASHFHYQVAGTMHVMLEDGTEFDVHAGEVVTLPQRHDAWVVGDEPVVTVDWRGAGKYAKS